MKNINKRFIQQTKILLKGQQSDAAYIWKCLDQSEQSQRNVYYFCLNLFQTLINSQKKVDVSENLQAMLSTILVLQFYKNMKQKPQSLTNDCKKLFAQNHMKLHGHAQWVINLFLKSSQQSQFAKEFISRVCHSPLKISWKIQPGKQFQDVIQSAQIFYRQLQVQKSKEQRFHKILKHTSFPPTFLQSKILSLGYICFSDYLRSSNFEVIKPIYEHMLDLLKGFIHAARITQKTSQLFLSYLFLLKTLITFYGCKYDQILKEMLYLLNIARNFQALIANYAHELFQIVHSQIKCKGTTFRKRIRIDFPSIDMKIVDTLAKKVYVISNTQPIFNTKQSCGINNLRKLFIYNMLGCCDSQAAVKYWKSIQVIDNNATFQLYYKLSKMIQLTMVLQNYRQLKKLQCQSISQLFKLNPLIKAKLPKQQLQQLSDHLNHQHSLKYFAYPIAQIIQIKSQHFQNKKHQFSINQLFQNLRGTQMFYQSKLSLLFKGDDYQIGKSVKTLAIHMEELPLNILQKLQVYLVPSKKQTSSLAEYIANKDLWYKRFVYSVFKQKILYPDTQMNEYNKDLFPTYLQKKSLQMYIRESQRIFPVQVYKCILTLKDSDQQEIIYFFSHLLIGSSAEIQIVKNINQKTKKSSYVQDNLDIYLEKIKKTSTICVDLAISYKQTLNKQTVKRTEKKLNIQDLQICNVPRDYFMGNVPKPNEKCLEVSILTQKMGKVYRRQLQNKQTFKRNSQHEIRQAFKDLFINLTADYIAIDNQSQQPLKVVIDGAATNKVQRLLILPAENKDRYPMRIPIKTFLPFQV